MNMEKYVKEKIGEYLCLMQECGYIRDRKTLHIIHNKLNSLKIELIKNAPGNANITGDTLYICWENIVANANKHGQYYFDEVLFHEFSHFINSFHDAIYGENRFDIGDCIQNKMSPFTNYELLVEGDELLYNQDPYLGVIMLDEFIAQYIAQNLVKAKFKKMNKEEKKQYVFDNELTDYQTRLYETNICEPPTQVITSFATYPEFDMFARNFLMEYDFIPYEFALKSLNPNFLKEFINSLDSKSAEKLYVDLCYLGIIKERCYILKGFKEETDQKDPANDPKKVYKVMKKLLNGR